jgi:hypothetical protein
VAKGTELSAITKTILPLLDECTEHSLCKLEKFLLAIAEGLSSAANAIEFETRGATPKSNLVAHGRKQQRGGRRSTRGADKLDKAGGRNKRRVNGTHRKGSTGHTACTCTISHFCEQDHTFLSCPMHFEFLQKVDGEAKHNLLNPTTKAAEYTIHSEQLRLFLEYDAKLRDPESEGVVYLVPLGYQTFSEVMNLDAGGSGIVATDEDGQVLISGKPWPTKHFNLHGTTLDGATMVQSLEEKGFAVVQQKDKEML